tara:strand:+ start:677 stop:1054 length:378 start_codon:yes stop_codon:yes gene_type:complete
MTDEVENEMEVQEVNPVANMIDYITNGDFVNANNVFNSSLADRIGDSIDQAKIAQAQAMWDPSYEEGDVGVEVELGADENIEGDEIDMELSDDEYDAAIDDLDTDDLDDYDDPDDYGDDNDWEND